MFYAQNFEDWLAERYDFIDMYQAFSAEELDELFEIYEKQQTVLTMGMLLED